MEAFTTAKLIASRTVQLALGGQSIALFHGENLDHIVILNPPAEALLHHAYAAPTAEVFLSQFKDTLGVSTEDAHAFIEAQIDIWSTLDGLTTPTRSWSFPTINEVPYSSTRTELGHEPVCVDIYDNTLATLWTELLRGHAPIKAEGGATIRAAKTDQGYVIQTVDGMCHFAPDILTARGEMVAAYIDAAFPDFRDTPNIHGATLVHPNGKTILVTGDSGQGKTTLSLALNKMGYQLAADDFSVFDPASERFFPIQFNPSVKSGAWPVLAPFYPALADAPAIQQGQRICKYLPRLPDQALAKAGHAVDVIIMPAWAPNAKTELVEEDPIAAILSLLENSHLPPHQKNLQAMLDYFAARKVYRLHYSEFDAARAALEGLVG